MSGSCFENLFDEGSDIERKALVPNAYRHPFHRYFREDFNHSIL